LRENVKKLGSPVGQPGFLLEFEIVNRQEIGITWNVNNISLLVYSMVNGQEQFGNNSIKKEIYSEPRKLGIFSVVELD
jgi:hypothetical protein